MTQGSSNIYPFFSSQLRQLDPNLCFVLMPFRPDMDEIYHDVIRPVVTTTPISLKCLRADEIYSVNQIMQDIWTQIVEAHIVVADLTYRNPNVMYELGLSHALGKKTVMLCQNVGDVPFDLRHIRLIVYDRGPRGVQKLTNDLRTTLRNLMLEPTTQPYLAAIQDLQKELIQLEQKIKELQSQNILKGRDEYTPLEPLASNAHDLFFAGPTLAIAAQRQHFYLKKIRDGCKLRFVLPSPDPSSPPMTGLYSHWHTPPEGFRSEVRSALVNFRLLKKLIPPDAPGSLELRSIDAAPTLSLLMIDGDSENGYLQVELLPFNTPAPDRPHFVLRPNEEPRWFSFLREKSEDLWARSMPVDIDAALALF